MPNLRVLDNPFAYHDYTGYKMIVNPVRDQKIFDGIAHAPTHS